MLAALMNGHHFLISAFWSAASAAGVCCSRVAITRPRSVRRWRTTVSARASTTATLSLAITPLGVPSGTHRPCQNEMYMPGAPISSVVGTSGPAGLGHDGKRLQLAAAHIGERLRRLGTHEVNLSAH